MAKTINQTYQDEYKSKKRRKLATVFLGMFLVSGAVIGGVYYALFWSQWLAVRNVEVDQKSFVSSGAIKQAVSDYLSERKFLVPRSNNIFLTDSKRVQALIAEQFPVLKNITVKRKYFHSLMIRADYRKAVGIWCFKKEGECFYFDQQGIAYDYAADSSGTLLLIVDDEAGLLKKVGQPVADSERLNWMLELQKEMSKAKVGMARVIITSEPYRVNVKTTEGWEIYFSTIDPLAPQIKALTIFLANKVSFEQRRQLQYIDVRIPQRVYYKLINTVLEGLHFKS